MPVSVTVASSPKRRKPVATSEARYLVELAAQIADDHPKSTVVAQYGQDAADVMVIKSSQNDAELF